MEKYYSISINLKGELLNKVRECHKILNENYSIKFMSEKSIKPHINIFSGKSKDIQLITYELKNFFSDNDRALDAIGLGVLLTPDPLIYIRFNNTAFIRDLRNYLYAKTFDHWSSIEKNVSRQYWIPKSTIAYSDISINQLSNVLLSLSSIDFFSQMIIEELSIIDFTKEELEIENFQI